VPWNVGKDRAVFCNHSVCPFGSNVKFYVGSRNGLPKGKLGEMPSKSLPGLCDTALNTVSLNRKTTGMLLEAGFISLFLAPQGWRPGVGLWHPPIRASVFLLLWEWFRIYFESGVAKIVSGDPEWRHFTAMDEYYQNGPLPTWIGWYVHHLPHWFHAATAFGTLALELLLVWMLFLPRRWRIVCFSIVTPWQIAIILTANYTFLVLMIGFLLLESACHRDKLVQQGFWTPDRLKKSHQEMSSSAKTNKYGIIGLRNSTVRAKNSG